MGPRPITFSISKNGCFEITSHHHARYPLLYIDKCHTSAHRFIWEECFGPIPPQMCVCHKCDNTHCINPEHLFLGTNYDNSLDREQKGRGRPPRGEENGQAKLDHYKVLEIRKRFKPYDSEDSGQILANEYHVSRRAITHIVKNTTWKHI